MAGPQALPRQAWFPSVTLLILLYAEIGILNLMVKLLSEIIPILSKSIEIVGWRALAHTHLFSFLMDVSNQSK